MARAELELPIERLGNTVAKAVHPLLTTVQALTRAVIVLTAKLGGAASPESESSIEHDESELDDPNTWATLPAQPKPVNDFDMESAIKASGQWECEGATFAEPLPGGHGHVVTNRQLRCTDCPLSQNLDCISTYKLLEEADRATGKTDGSDEQARLALHAALRPQGRQQSPVVVADDAYVAGAAAKVVPVERLVRPRLVPRLPQLEPAAQEALAKAGANAKALAEIRVAKVEADLAPAKPRRAMSAETKAKVAAGLAKARAAKAEKNAPAKVKAPLKASVADRLRAKAKSAKAAKKPPVNKGSKR